MLKETFVSDSAIYVSVLTEASEDFEKSEVTRYFMCANGNPVVEIPEAKFFSDKEISKSLISHENYNYVGIMRNGHILHSVSKREIIDAGVDNPFPSALVLAVNDCVDSILNVECANANN